MRHLQTKRTKGAAFLRESRGLKILLNHHSRKIQHHSLKMLQEGSLLIKMKDSRACLEGTQNGEAEQTRRTNFMHSKLVFAMGELKSKLKRTKKGEKKKF